MLPIAGFWFGQEQAFRVNTTMPADWEQQVIGCPSYNTTGAAAVTLKGLGLSQAPQDILSHGTALQFIDMSANAITRLQPGAFDSNQALVHLLLIDNGLRYLEAGVVQGLTRLQTLLLSQNYITEIATNALADLDALLYLWLADNALRQVPPAISGSAVGTLLSLDLADNRIAMISAGDFAGLGNVTVLKLGGNAVERVTASAFRLLTALSRPPSDFAPQLYVAAYPETGMHPTNGRFPEITSPVVVANMPVATPHDHYGPGFAGADPLSLNAECTASSTLFCPISHAPYAMCSPLCPCLSDAEWCFQSDAMPNLRLQG